MKHFIQAVVFVSGILFTLQTIAHEGHEHAVQLDQVTAVETASLKLAELIENGQLASKWAILAPVGAQLARVNGLQNWIVSYLDASARERLELVFSMTGEFVSMAQMPITDTAAN